jgi:hypothetical protein
MKTAYDLCKTAESLSGNSHLIQGCLGISSRELLSYEASAYHFERAYTILTSNPTNLLPFPNLGFHASIQEMELGLLDSLYKNQKYDRCVAWSSEFAGIPSVNQGGALILTLAMLKWEQKMVDFFFNF